MVVRRFQGWPLGETKCPLTKKMEKFKNDVGQSSKPATSIDFQTQSSIHCCFTVLSVSLPSILSYPVSFPYSLTWSYHSLIIVLPCSSLTHSTSSFPLSMCHLGLLLMSLLTISSFGISTHKSQDLICLTYQLCLTILPQSFQDLLPIPSHHSFIMFPVA